MRQFYQNNEKTMILTYIGRFCFVFLNLMFLPLCIAFAFVIPQTWLMRCAKPWGRACLFLLRTRIDLKNSSRLCMEHKHSFVYAAMHTSTLDTFLYIAILPWNTVYVAKAELKNHILLGLLFQRCGYIFVERKRSGTGGHLFLESVEKLSQGTSLFIHPEGTRIPDNAVRKARSGFALAAQKKQVGIIPITSAGGSELWKKGKWFPEPGKVEVFVHESWSVEEVANSNTSDLCARYDNLCNTKNQFNISNNTDDSDDSDDNDNLNEHKMKEAL